MRGISVVLLAVSLPQGLALKAQKAARVCRVRAPVPSTTTFSRSVTRRRTRQIVKALRGGGATQPVVAALRGGATQSVVKALRGGAAAQPFAARTPAYYMLAAIACDSVLKKINLDPARALVAIGAAAAAHAAFGARSRAELILRGRVAATPRPLDGLAARRRYIL